MSLARRLISAGFSDLEKGERFLAAPELEGIDEDALFVGLSMAASPDTALQTLVRLIEKNPGLKKLAAADPDASEPMYRLLGASEALGSSSSDGRSTWTFSMSASVQSHFRPPAKISGLCFFAR